MKYSIDELFNYIRRRSDGKVAGATGIRGPSPGICYNPGMNSSPDGAAPPARKIQRRDWPWLLAYPAYQLIGTVRHEAGHALAALLEGGQIRKFVFWPTWDRQFYWGYVQWSGKVGWLTSAAPYLLDLLTFVVFYFICTRVEIKRHGLWVNLCIIGLISPLVNSGYRYASSFFRDGDLTSVMAAVPPAFVHAYFILTVVVYILGLVRIQRSGRNFTASVGRPANP